MWQRNIPCLVRYFPHGSLILYIPQEVIEKHQKFYPYSLLYLLSAFIYDSYNPVDWTFQWQILNWSKTSGIKSHDATRMWCGVEVMCSRVNTHIFFPKASLMFEYDSECGILQVSDALPVGLSCVSKHMYKFISNIYIF